MSISRTRKVLSNALLCALGLFAGAAQAQQQTVTMWSHWPDEASKRSFVDGQVKAFEAATPSCKVNLQFIQKADLYTSAKTAVRTGQAPDIFWLEPDEIAFAKSGYLEPLDGYIDLNKLEDWARRSWTHNGKVYALPLEAYTVELYYNRDLLKKIGVNPPASMQFGQAEFTDMVKKAAAAGITPIASGRRRPAVSGCLPAPGSVAAQARHRRLRAADDRQAVVPGPARDRGDDLGQAAGRRWAPIRRASPR